MRNYINMILFNVINYPYPDLSYSVFMEGALYLLKKYIFKMSRCCLVHVFPYGVLECARKTNCKYKINLNFSCIFSLACSNWKLFQFRAPYWSLCSQGFHWPPLHCLNMSFFSTQWKQHHMLSHWGWDKMADTSRWHFQMHFLEWKCLNFKFNLTKVCSWGANFGSDNSLEPNRRQANIWTNDGLGWWRIYAPLSLNELKLVVVTKQIG